MQLLWARKKRLRVNLHVAFGTAGVDNKENISLALQN